MSPTNDPKPPTKEFCAGKVRASVWRTEVQRDGDTVIQWSTKIEKKYFDKDSKEWRTTDYYYPSELADLLLVVRRALEFARLREIERPVDDPAEVPDEAAA